jgi:glycosyltransferase involved in cell wall biosynthesis
VKHFALLLYGGDYFEASVRRKEGLPDRYRHHSYALDVLDQLRARGTRVSVVQVHSAEPYDRAGPSGIRFIGFGEGGGAEAQFKVASYVRTENVSHVMLRFPSVPILRELVGQQVHTSVVLADSFPPRFWRRNRRLEFRRLLRHGRVDFVANHHMNSSRQLIDVFDIDAHSVIPWDWPLDLLELAASSTKVRPADGKLRLCFAGAIEPTKGVWDALKALQVLRRRGEDASLEIAGAGQVDAMVAAANRYGVRDHVMVRGRIGCDQIIEMMQRSSFVCVPSHHAYPEGLPLTLYEAMASGTPLVASDHPMFKGLVRDGQTGFVFRAGSPTRMASAIQRGWQDKEAYSHVSSTAAATYPTLGVTPLWGDLVLRWVRGDPGDVSWLSSNSMLARGV